MPVAVRRLLVVLAVAGVGFVPAPATAAGYCTGPGVNVVVDFGAIGGGVAKGCGTGSTAAAVFASAGFALTRDAQYRSVVCKVNGQPADANCATMPAGDAYWGLFWSDGTSGRWSYSSVSVDALEVSSGGFVAFAWQASSGQRAPAATPSNPRPSPTPSPTPKPIRAPTKKAGPVAGATGTSAATASAAPSASATATGSATASATPSTSSPSASPSLSGAATVSGPAVSATAADAGNADSGGLAWWVPVVVLLALAGGAGGAWWTRRRASGG